MVMAFPPYAEIVGCASRRRDDGLAMDARNFNFRRMIELVLVLYEIL